MGHKDLTIITKHSKKRCKERLGLSKGDTNKMAEKAIEFGINYRDTSGSLRRYMSYLYESHNKEANNIILYNREVYIFNNKKLITIFHVPNQYYSTCDKIQKRKKEGKING